MGFLGFLKKKPENDLSFGEDIPKPPESMFPNNSTTNDSSDSSETVQTTSPDIPPAPSESSIAFNSSVSEPNLSNSEVSQLEDSKFELPDLPGEEIPTKEEVEEVFGSHKEFIPPNKEDSSNNIEEDFVPPENPNSVLEKSDLEEDLIPPEKPDDYIPVDQPIDSTAPKELFIAADEYFDQIDRIKKLKKIVRETDSITRSLNEQKNYVNDLFSTLNTIQEELIKIDTQLFER